jgi:ATP-dependent DNA helicase RecG
MTEIDQVLALPPAEAWEALTVLPESQWFERKSARIAPRDLAVPLVAMANAEGGYVVVGIREGRVEAIGQRRINEYRQVAVDFTQPHVAVHASEIPAAPDGSILVLRVEPGEQVHTTAGGDCYLRVGDESRKLNYTDRQALEWERGSGPFDGKPVDAGIADLDRDLMSEYCELIGSSSIENMLHARSLITRRGGLTVAALLLFADDPQLEFPSAHVRVLRYSEPYRGVGADHTLYADGDIRFSGPIPQQIRQAAAQIDLWVPKRRALRASGLFEPVPLLPRAAWLEGLVNAVVHRNYANQGEHIRVEMFPDRIEIVNPGRFPGPIEPKDPTRVRRQARNPRIVRVCGDMHIGEELGEGIRRIFATMRDAGLGDPTYILTGESVRLTLSMTKRLDPKIAADLPAKALALLDIMRQEAAPLSTGEIARLASLTNPTAGRHLARLQAAGLVYRNGGAPQDRYAAWSVV